MDEENADKTTLITIEGSLRFRMMPFGGGAGHVPTVDGSGHEWAEFEDMSSLPRRYHRLFGRRPESSGAIESSVLTLEGSRVKRKPGKFKLYRRRVGLLGHMASEEGFEADSAMIGSVVSWPVPTTVRNVSSFLRLCSYYRRFVKDFAEMVTPLHALTGKYVLFQSTDEC